MNDLRCGAFYNREHVINQGKSLLAAVVAERCEIPLSAVWVKVQEEQNGSVTANYILDQQQAKNQDMANDHLAKRHICEVVAAKTEAALKRLGARWSAYGY
ncbi:MAG: hypothetical protein EOO40_00560 [Deltaproteobacteria bacterium]|nr:MAG: hypothetical protein EOO40_00560 [Deltaproteobacteria bacterium]